AYLADKLTRPPADFLFFQIIQQQLRLRRQRLGPLGISGLQCLLRILQKVLYLADLRLLLFSLLCRQRIQPLLARSNQVRRLLLGLWTSLSPSCQRTDRGLLRRRRCSARNLNRLRRHRLWGWVFSLPPSVFVCSKPHRGELYF